MSSTILLHPAYKNNNQMRGGLGLICAARMYHSIGHMEFPNFTPEFLLNGKRPRLWTRICVDLKGFASLYVLAGKMFCTTWIRNIPLETCVREHLKCQEVTPV